MSQTLKKAGRKTSQVEFKICELAECNETIPMNGRNAQLVKRFCCEYHARKQHARDNPRVKLKSGRYD